MCRCQSNIPGADVRPSKATQKRLSGNLNCPCLLKLLHLKLGRRIVSAEMVLPTATIYIASPISKSLELSRYKTTTVLSKSKQIHHNPLIERKSEKWTEETLVVFDCLHKNARGNDREWIIWGTREKLGGCTRCCTIEVSNNAKCNHNAPQLLGSVQKSNKNKNHRKR